MKGRKTIKLTFRGAYRLPGTGIVECSEISGESETVLTWLTLTPIFYMYVTRRCLTAASITSDVLWDRRS